MKASQLEKLLADLTRERGDRTVCVFVPGLGDLEIRGLTTVGQIGTVAPRDDFKDLLLCCAEKLRCYRKGHSGEYVGGVEYTELQRRIERMLEELRR